MAAMTAPSSPVIGIPPAPGNIASGEQAMKPVAIGAGSVRIRPRWTRLGICCVAAIHAFERARAIPPAPPRSIREADTSTPLAADHGDRAAHADVLGLGDRPRDQRAGVRQRHVHRVDHSGSITTSSTAGAGSAALSRTLRPRWTDRSTSVRSWPSSTR